MKLLLVTIRKRAGSDEVSRRETILEGQEIHLGRAVSMEICLPDIGVDFQHATLTHEGGKLVMKASSPGGISVGGSERDEADLMTESASIGRFTFKGEAGRDGADAVLVMEEAPPAAANAGHALKGRKRLLEDVLPSRRLLGWVFSLAVLGVFLVWPMMDVMQRPGMQSDASDATAQVVDGMARKDLPNTTPMEIAWSSGPLSQAHQMIEEDCAACHVRPFEMTANTACLSCHAQTTNHSDIAEHPAVSLENTRCASCHKEHNGGEAPVETASSACVSCHADIKTVSAKSTLDNINGFASDHPQFQLAVIKEVTVSPETGVVSRIERVPFTKDTVVQENPGLKFPHSKHLVEGGVRSPAGKTQLQCANCHLPEPTGLMRAIDMERDCAGCHKMTFNAAGVERTLPHADEDEVARILTDYFISAAMEGGVTAETAPEPVKRKRRRRIAGENTSEQRAEQTGLSDAQRGQAIEWAQQETLVQMDTIFGVRLCGNCHEAQKFEDKTGTERWQVQPAQLQRHWMPRANFNHMPHEAMDCTSCHDAAKSEKSSDVLMVGKDTCADCHNDTAQGAVSTCVSCHEYHIPGKAPMSPEHAELFQARADARQHSPAPKQ